MRLRHGVTIAGRVIGPDGASVANAIVLARTYRPYRTQSGALSSINGNAARDQFMAFNGRAPMIRVRDGRFEIPGCDPESPYTFHFFDREHGSGRPWSSPASRSEPDRRRSGSRSAGRPPFDTRTLRANRSWAGRETDWLLVSLARHRFPGSRDECDRPGAPDDLGPRACTRTKFRCRRSRHLRVIDPRSDIPARKHDFKAEAGKTIELPEITAGSAPSMDFAWARLHTDSPRFIPKLGYDDNLRGSTGYGHEIDGGWRKRASMASLASGSVLAADRLAVRRQLGRRHCPTGNSWTASPAARYRRRGGVHRACSTAWTDGSERLHRRFWHDRHRCGRRLPGCLPDSAQKAHSIRDADLLGNWLYGVALRTARHARLQLARCRKNEEAASMVNATSSVAIPSAEQSFLAREQAELLHDEIEQLPRAFRLAVVSCYLEGLTVHEAARRLGCSHGTVRSRMARRGEAGRGCTRRGVGLPATALAAALSFRPASASVSSQLCETTAQAAIQFAAGQAASLLVVSLAREVRRSMMFHKLKLVSLTLMLLGAFATSAGYPTGAGEERSARPIAGPGVRTANTTTQEVGPRDWIRIGSSSRACALAPDGKPVPGGGSRSWRLLQPQPHPSGESQPERPQRYQVLGSARADADGRYRVDFPRTAVDRDGLSLVVGATGWAFTGKKLDPDLASPDQSITVDPEHVVRGRIFDLQGQPIAGVKRGRKQLPNSSV